MNFKAFYNNILREELSREDRIKILKSDTITSKFKFAFVSWNASEEIPVQIHKYLNSKELPYALGFVGDVNRLVERYRPNPSKPNEHYDICFCNVNFPTGGLVSNYLRAAIDNIEYFTDVLKYDKNHEYWMCSVDIEDLKAMVDEMIPEEDDDDEVR